MAHIVIGGAGIGGLTAAIAIAQQDHTVTLLERRPALTEVGAGLQLAPNATRILAGLGLLEAVRARASEPETIRIRRAGDGADIVRLPLGQAARRFGAPFLVIHRADLQGVLAATVEAAHHVDLRFESDVSAVTKGDAGVTVSFASDWTPLRGDGFVDASGVHADRGPGAYRPVARLTAWRALLPSESLPRDLMRPDTNLWLGPGAHLVHYPIRAGSMVNVVAITPRVQDRENAGADIWSEPGDPDELRARLRGWHRDATQFLDYPVDWRCWPLIEAPPLPQWSDGPVTRLGDAAHPMLPFLAQGASQAIEDAGALAEALSGSDDIAAAFARYARRRAPRAARVQRASRRQGDLYHLNRPASDARDLVMRSLGGARALARMDWLYERA